MVTGSCQVCHKSITLYPDIGPYPLCFQKRKLVLWLYEYGHSTIEIIGQNISVTDMRPTGEQIYKVEFDGLIMSIPLKMKFAYHWEAVNA